MGSNLQTKSRSHSKSTRVLPLDVVLVVLSPIDLMRGRIAELVAKGNPPT